MLNICQAGKIWQQSVQDEKLEILCVSQFASYHRLKGNKPDFHLAMQVDLAQQLYQTFLQRMGKEYNVEKIKDLMQVHIQNDGPVNIELESPIVEAKPPRPNSRQPQVGQKQEECGGDSSAEKLRL